MRTTSLSILLAAVASLAFGAHAQEAPVFSLPEAPTVSGDSGRQELGWDGDAWRNAGVNIDNDNSIRFGVGAMKDNDFMEAEEIFAQFLRRKPTHADANFYMGVAGMNLGKWEDAKKHLEIAVTKKPKHPDPKSRLGVTYAKLGDTAGAYAQRADLVKMADACKGECRLSPYITAGIQMIDKALAEPPASSS